MVKFALICIFALSVVTSGVTQTANAAEKGPIKIGFIAPLTGPFAQLGMDMVDGFKMFMDEINNTVAGRKIEVIVEDEAASPDIAISKVRKLISHDKVSMIAGVFQGSISYAIAPITVKEKIPFVNTASASDDLTQRKRSEYLIRLCWTGGQLGHVAGDYGYHKLGWRKAAILGYDYSWGYENAGGFQRVFEELGGKVIQKIWVPVGTMDFGPYIANLKPDADGLFEVVTGAPSIRLVKALRGSGLMDKWKVMLPGTGVDETLLPALGDDGIGLYSPWTYSVALDNPENRKFVEKRKKSYKKEATSVMAMCYTGADWIVRGIKAVNGDVENREKLMDALRAVDIPDSIQGPLKVDKYGQAVTNIYIRRVDKVGNSYQNTIVETYPMVSQFWKYDPETYLKSPLYTRDYPPCKFCE
jgi:branched-chain amino acid transport system substrate-binding protein